jgi:hypothetical protein
MESDPHVTKQKTAAPPIRHHPVSGIPWRTMIIWAPPLLLLLVWMLLYLPYLRSSPGWYSDETLVHYTGQKLTKGEWANFGLYNTFWHPHYPYQLGYTFVTGWFGRLFQGDILGSRFFNTLLVLTASQLAYLFLRRSMGPVVALFSALILLCMPEMVIHYRMAYPHNAVGLGFMITALALCRRRPDCMAGSSGLAIAALAHPLFIHGALAAWLASLRRPKLWIPLFLPAGICVVVALACSWFKFGDWLLEDLQHLWWTYAQRSATDGASGKWWLNLYRFVCQDWFHLGAYAGLVLSLFGRFRAIGIMGIVVTLLILQNRQNIPVFYYQAIVFMPTVILGWGILLYESFRLARARCGKSGARIGLIVLGSVLVLALFLPVVARVLEDDLRPRNYPWVTHSLTDLENAARWINERTQPDDFVIANPNISILLHCYNANFLQTVTWLGYPTQGYENGNKHERFRANASWQRARFAVVGEFDAIWSLHEPNVHLVWNKMMEEKWPVVWQSNTYMVLANPRYLAEDRNKQP